MKNTKLVITFLLGALVAGCSKSATSDDTTASAQFQKVEQDTNQTAQDMKDYTYAQKDEFVAKMQTELDALNQELAQLYAKVDQASDEAKTEAKPKLDALRAQVVELNAELDKARNATESTWTEVKAGAQKAMDATTDAFKQAGQWISKQFGS